MPISHNIVTIMCPFHCHGSSDPSRPGLHQTPKVCCGIWHQVSDRSFDPVSGEVWPPWSV